MVGTRPIRMDVAADGHALAPAVRGVHAKVCLVGSVGAVNDSMVDGMRTRGEIQSSLVQKMAFANDVIITTADVEMQQHTAAHEWGA